jgi:hypothetical protein
MSERTWLNPKNDLSKMRGLFGRNFHSNGKLIEKRLATGKGIEAWNCTECPSGIYLIRMMAEGIELATTKVSIVK